MDPQLRLRNLLVMALADGTLGERETQFVTDRCHQMGLGEQELRDAIRYALDDHAQMQLPANLVASDPVAAESLLTELFQLMAIDQRWEGNEKRLFASCAARLGFNSQSVDRLLCRLHHPSDDQP